MIDDNMTTHAPMNFSSELDLPSPSAPLQAKFAPHSISQTAIHFGNFIAYNFTDDAETNTGSYVVKLVVWGTRSPTHRLLERLGDLCKTPDDKRWPEATWPTDQAFDEAREFIKKLPLAQIPVPEIHLADDGEINFLWKNPKVHVDLGFYGTGTYSYYALDTSSEQEFEADSAPIHDGLASEIKNLLKYSD